MSSTSNNQIYHSNNERVAKNTIFLYFRMIIILVLSLYTSRVILNILGEEDFGIYNIVAGVVVLFSFLTNALTSSTQRYLNYSLGKSEKSEVLKTFNTSIFVHIAILAVVLILSETIGLWFVINKLNIPEGREDAVLWVYQMAVLTTLLNIIVIPYRASIIASEKMQFFAYVSIIDVILKLAIVLVLPFFTIDRLIMYSCLFAAVTFFSFVLYFYSCKIKLDFAKFSFIWDKQYFKEMLFFSGWYLLGGFATVGERQGMNIMLNIFYSVSVNAAVGIANQVKSGAMSFVGNFLTAMNPQLVKLYASNQHKEFIHFMLRSSKFSYYLTFLVSFPLILCCSDILSFWLVKVPDYAIIFTQLTVVVAIFEALSSPLMTAIGATGKIAKYQFLVSLILLSVLPVSYLLLSIGAKPQSVFYVDLIVNVFAYIFRLFYIRKQIYFGLREYFFNVILPVFIITILATPVPIIMKLTGSSPLYIIVTSLCLTIIFVYWVGLSVFERKYINSLIINKLNIKLK